MSLPETYKALFSVAKTGDKPEIKEVPIQKPGKNQVLVKVDFAPINPTDTMTMHGPGTPQFVGSEGSGTVVAIGEDLRYPVKIGDKVHLIGPGTMTNFFFPTAGDFFVANHKVGDTVHVSGPGSMAQYALLTSDNAVPVKEGISLEEAACHFVNPGTVVYMGKVAEEGNHKAVIHTAGSSALGRMLIRYFKQKGIKTINVVRRDDFNEELKKEGADYILNSKSPDFDQQLKDIANKEQATMALDAIGGDFLSRVVNAQPPHSICYIYGALAGEFTVKEIPIGNFFQGKRIAGLIIYKYCEQLGQKGELRKFVEEVHTLFKSHIQKVFKLEEFQEALAYYEENSSKGKILLKPN